MSNISRVNPIVLSILKSVVITAALSIMVWGCINREEEEEGGTLEPSSEFSVIISEGDNYTYYSDSLFLSVDHIISDLWSFSITAKENFSESVFVTITALGIQFPGELYINDSGIFGAVSYTNASGSFFSSQVSGGGGSIIVTKFTEFERLAGTFQFTLYDTLTDEQVSLLEGQFDAVIDESLYLNL